MAGATGSESAGADRFEYTGGDNLEVMTHAVRYNESLVGLIVDAAPQRDAEMLDFGSGIGLYARLLRDRGYKHITCFEPDPEQAAGLVRTGLDAVDDRNVLDDRRFDAAYLLNVLEHIEDDREAVDWLAGRLRPGGCAIVYVPAFELLFTSMDAKVGHHRRYTQEGLRRLFDGPEWAIERMAYADSLGFFATLAYRLIGSSQGDVSVRSVRFYDRFVFPASHVLDRLAGRLFGKNVQLVARRTAADVS